MNPAAPSTPSQRASSAASLRAELLTLLQSAQNPDGGWPFHPGGQSRVEPTCWVLRALADSPTPLADHLTRGLGFLKSAQLPDGAWSAASDGPSPAENTAGGWVTSLAVGTLAQFASSEADNQQSIAGLQWLCDDYPRDSSAWQKFIGRFKSTRHIASHNDEFRGWGWTPRTASWVEPTAFALMAFQECLAPRSPLISAPNSPLATRFSPLPSERQGAPASRFEPGAGPASLPSHLAESMNERSTLATGLLNDRMCPRGGWNCGNPRVYGVDGDPLVLPTCFALLAVRNAPEHPNRALSLAWLQSEFPKIQSAASLAIATIALDSYGVSLPQAQHSLLDWPADDLVEQATHVASWVSLALNPSRTWPGGAR